VDRTPEPGGFLQLALVPRETSFLSQEGWRRVHQPVPFLDFVVDGVSLRTMAEHAGHRTDLVTHLCGRWAPSQVAATVDKLLRGDESVEMLVCPVCGDPGCGAVLADVSLQADRVVWSHWRWMDHQNEVEHIAMPPMHFERDSYERLISRASQQVAASPSSSPGQRSRPSWPWRWGWRLPRSGQ
jgi:hypothetical protein